MIKFNNVRKIFKTDFYAKPFTALDDFSFQIPENKVVGFLGANGAGKTTSIKIIMGFIQANSGTVEFASSLGINRRNILKKIGYLPERPYFYPHLTGREFITYMGRLNEMSCLDIVSGIKKWTNRFGIEFALDRKVRDYSKGMLQRLGFVAALIHNPDLLILDEPLSGLDPIGRKELKDAIVEVHQEGKTVFFSSHIVPDVEEVCDTVIFLEKGKLLYQGSIDELIVKNIGASYLIKVGGVIDLDNLSSKYNLKRLIPFEGGASFEVESSQKDSCLRAILELGGDVHQLAQSKMSLEEIFYNVKNKERDILNEHVGR